MARLTAQEILALIRRNRQKPPPSPAAPPPKSSWRDESGDGPGSVQKLRAEGLNSHPPDATANFADAFIASLATSRPSAAARARVYRQRQRDGEQVAPVSLPPEVVAALLDRGVVSPAEASDRRCLGLAVREIARLWATGVVK